MDQGHLESVGQPQYCNEYLFCHQANACGKPSFPHVSRRLVPHGDASAITGVDYGTPTYLQGCIMQLCAVAGVVGVVSKRHDAKGLRTYHIGGTSGGVNDGPLHIKATSNTSSWQECDLHCDPSRGSLTISSMTVAVSKNWI